MPDFELFPGKVLAVIGANGSGKSTLAGVIAPDGGQSPLGREIRAAYMPQKSYRQPSCYSVKRREKYIEKRWET